MESQVGQGFRRVFTAEEAAHFGFVPGKVATCNYHYCGEKFMMPKTVKFIED